jgi:hypothetical protein
MNQTPAQTTVVITPPTIENLKWTPTRIQNDKVYDGNISFDVKNKNSPPSEVELDFAPLFPSQIPKAAIPTEDQRSYALKPVSTVAETNTMSFSQDIAGLKGGKQYRAIVTITESTGNEILGYADTPYVREFENISGKSQVLTGAHWMPFFAGFGSGGWENWNTSNSTPLLGEYDSGDDLVISKQIDWAAGHRIDFFTLDWFGTRTITTPYFYWSTRNIESFLKNELLQDFRFMIMFDSSILVSEQSQLELRQWNVDDNANRKILQDGFGYIVDNYFPHSSYLKISGRYPLYFWASISWVGNVKNLLDSLRSIAKSRGYEPYFIGDPVQFYHPNSDRVNPWDAVTQFENYSITNPSIDRNVEATTDYYYREWSSMAKSLGVNFIPSVLPGFHRLSNPDWPVLPKSTDRLRNQIDIAMKYLDPRIRLAFITTFNDWTENTQIEPSVEDGFKYLQTLRDTLAGH